MIDIRFDLIYSAHNRGTVILHRGNYPQVPGVGDLVNINGNPYRVVCRGWAVGNDDGQLYAYVEVDKASGFDVKIGGRTY